MNYSNPYNNVKGQLKDDKDQRLNSGLHGNEYDSIYSEGHNKNTSKYQVISPPVMYKKQRAEDNALYRGRYINIYATYNIHKGYVNNSETMTNEVVHSAGISEEKFGDYLTNSKIYARKLPELKETKIIKEQKSPYLDSGLLRPCKVFILLSLQLTFTFKKDIKDPVAFIKRPKVKGRLNINLSAKKEIVGSLYAGVMNPQQPVPNGTIMHPFSILYFE